MKYCAIFVDNFDDIEAITVINLLRRAAIDIDIYGIRSNIIKSFTKVSYNTDFIFNFSDNINTENYNGIILSGGPGVVNLFENYELIKIVKQFSNENKLIFAICGAPVILEKAGILKCKNYTCNPKVENLITSGKFINKNVVIDDNIVTSRALGTSMEAALTLVEIIKSKAEKEQLCKEFLINN